MLLKNKEENLLINHFIENKIHYSTTVGNSMYPMLRDRKDRVIIKSLERPVRLLDVVFYKRPSGKIILHRIIAISRDYYFICGDNQYLIEKIPKDWILGRLVSFYRGNNYYQVDDKRYLIYSILCWVFLPLRIFILFFENQLSRRWK